MTAILIRLAPYLLAAAAVFSGGWYAGGLQPKAALARLQAADDHTRAVQAEAALKAVQGQLAQAQVVSANNAQTVEKLNAQNALIAADRDGTVARVRRLEQLLELAAHPAAHGSDLPQTGSGQPVAGPSDNAGAPAIEGLLVAAAGECEQTANQLNSLIAEIRPQL